MSDSPYPNYPQSRNEAVRWFAEPLPLGYRVPSGTVFVALGIGSLAGPLLTVEALIIDQLGREGERPQKLGRLWKWTTNFHFRFFPAALEILRRDHGVEA